MQENNNENGRFHRDDSPLLVALASGASIRKAAATAGISEATVMRRLEEEAFRRELSKLRAQMIDRAIGKLASSLTAASATLRKLLKASSETVRLGASRAIVELYVRAKEAGELEQRLSELESLLNVGNRR
jgi:hypothetical protein